MDNSRHISRDIKQFYNNTAEKFSQTRSHFWPGFDFIRKYYKGQGKILDFGCGNGRLIEFLKSNMRNNVATNLGEILKEEYVGVDISEKLIEIARQKYPGYDFQVINDERKLSFKDNQFDYIFSIAVFHHFSPKMAEESLNELRRVLKKGGIIIISVWHLWHWKYLKYLFKSILKYIFPLQADLPFKDNGGKTHWRYCYFWTEGRLERLAKKGGFDILRSGFTFDKKDRKRNAFVVIKK